MTALGDLEDKVKGFAAGAAELRRQSHSSTRKCSHGVRTHVEMRRLQLVLQAGNQALDAKVAERTAELKKALEQVERLKNRLQSETPTCNRKSRSRQVIAISSATARALKEMLRKVDLVAAADTTVLIHGENGNPAKELIARAVHERSPRRERPMVKLNCSAISAGLVESELFGHLKGAFTGASDKRVGRFELADGGNIIPRRGERITARDTDKNFCACCKRASSSRSAVPKA